ncbi:recombinase family protein [Flavobacterium sp. TAB 87]|uniref:recombinase family protein n=1 Tax=Flavobacterium sp. TAB 87 TaxID=1729581 RepID=UPI0009EBDB42|nr:recombinase family protein [Flavobacterium sp. TAB 87]
MKKIADLYVRVSTDEQADRGYSQRNQEEVLRKYCDINSITIRDIIYEDHSAKTFNRPRWKALLANLKKHKNKIDLVLFTKWDRFSRNAGDAYQMINMLRKLAVEPQSIEQPLDLEIPENKMMLAFYLAAPEVENDRRALNTFHGMRRARKEGRYMGLAPSGYVNKIHENGIKYIDFDKPQAAIIKWAFEEISKDKFNTEQIYRQAKLKGLRTSKNNFWRIIRNPLYCGKIVIPQYKDEEQRFVTGSHEALISQGLFYLVQDVLDGRRKKIRPKIVTTEPFPLRGFFVFPKCENMLTASISKGRSKKYPYYHCRRGCTYRINSTKANSIFIKNLKRYTPKAEFEKLYVAVITECYNENTKESLDQKNKIIEELKECEKRISYTRDLLVSQQLSVKEYNEIKENYDAKIRRLDIQLAAINDDKNNISDLLKSGVSNLMKLDKCYVEGDLLEIRRLIGSIYPENFTILENEFRAARVNEVVNIIYLINNELDPNKNGTKKKNSSLSHKVTATGFEPATLRVEI